MAVVDKVTLKANFNAMADPITRVELLSNIEDLIDSYEDIIQEFTTAQRDALAGGDLYEGRKIYNTTNNRMEFYNGTSWIACSQKPTVAVDCSGTPNYPEGSIGDQYIVSVAGKIGGASGKTVYVGDMVYCTAKNAGGNEATVGTSWAVCYSGSSADSPTRYVQVALSSAEILALFATPKEVVAAPGAGKIIVPIASVFNYTYNSIEYLTSTSVYLYNTAGSEFQCGLISGTANLIKTTAPTIFTSIANTALFIHAQTADPTAGNGTATISVYYKIHTL